MARATEHPAFWPSYQAALTAILTENPRIADTYSAHKAAAQAFQTAYEAVAEVQRIEASPDDEGGK
jgi:hypothetical protein